MPYSLTIEVPTLKTDSNRILGVNKFVKNNRARKAKSNIAIMVRGKEPHKPLEKFLISVVRHGQKHMDWDNLISSLKAHIDGLRVAGIIKNDSWKYIRHIDVDQVISKTEKKLVIKIESLSSLDHSE